jgi:hypothetical protein
LTPMPGLEDASNGDVVDRWMVKRPHAFFNSRGLTFCSLDRKFGTIRQNQKTELMIRFDCRFAPRILFLDPSPATHVKWCEVEPLSEAIWRRELLSESLD